MGLLVNAYQCAKFQLPSSISFGETEGPKIKKNGGAGLPRRPLADKFYTESQYLQMPTTVPNFNFLAPLITEI